MAGSHALALVAVGDQNAQITDSYRAPIRLTSDALVPADASMALALATSAHNKRNAQWGQASPPKRRKRFGESWDKPYKPPPVLMDMPVGLTEEDVDQFFREQRLQELTDNIEFGRLEDVDPDIRPPSPPPVYDREGRRLNTREDRVKKAMKAEWDRLVRSLRNKINNFGMPEGWTLGKLVQKLIIPYDRYPNAPFNGVIIGARGVNHKHLEEKTGCRIRIKGQNMGEKHQSEEERAMPPHVHIEAEDEDQMEAAVKILEPLLNPESPEFEYARTQGMMQVAHVNGYSLDKRENRCSICGALGHLGFNCPEANVQLGYKMANVVCEICGDRGHVTADCKVAQEAQKIANLDWKEQAKKKREMDAEYANFMNELNPGSSPPPAPQSPSSSSDSQEQDKEQGKEKEKEESPTTATALVPVGPDSNLSKIAPPPRPPPPPPPPPPPRPMAVRPPHLRPKNSGPRPRRGLGYQGPLQGQTPQATAGVAPPAADYAPIHFVPAGHVPPPLGASFKAPPQGQAHAQGTTAVQVPAFSKSGAGIVPPWRMPQPPTPAPPQSAGSAPAALPKSAMSTIPPWRRQNSSEGALPTPMSTAGAQQQQQQQPQLQPQAFLTPKAPAPTPQAPTPTPAPAQAPTPKPTPGPAMIDDETLTAPWAILPDLEQVPWVLLELGQRSGCRIKLGPVNRDGSRPLKISSTSAKNLKKGKLLMRAWLDVFLRGGGQTPLESFLPLRLLPPRGLPKDLPNCLKKGAARKVPAKGWPPGMRPPARLRQRAAATTSAVAASASTSASTSASAATAATAASTAAPPRPVVVVAAAKPACMSQEDFDEL